MQIPKPCEEYGVKGTVTSSLTIWSYDLNDFHMEELLLY